MPSAAVEAHARGCEARTACTSLRSTPTACDAAARAHAGGYYPVNIFTHPFNFSWPELIIREGVYKGSPWKWQRKVIGLFRLPALLAGGGRRFVIRETDWARAGAEVVDVSGYASRRRQ
jgi:hypothetical protein